MTRVLGVIGSPRKTGNTATLVKAFVNSAAAAGAETTTVLLNTLNIRGCQACYLCKSSGVCAVKDEMSPLYAQITQADVMVFGSPIYMGSLSGQAKMVLDRLYFFLKPDFSSRLAPGKTAVLLLAQGNPQSDTYAAYIESLEHIFKTIGFTDVKTVVAAGVRDRGAVLQHKELIAEIQALGQHYASITE